MKIFNIKKTECLATILAAIYGIALSYVSYEIGKRHSDNEQYDNGYNAGMERFTTGYNCVVSGTEANPSLVYSYDHDGEKTNVKYQGLVSDDIYSAITSEKYKKKLEEIAKMFNEQGYTHHYSIIKFIGKQGQRKEEAK